MGKLQNALTAAGVEFIDATIDMIPDPILRAKLKVITFSVKVPYAFLKELLPSETDDFVKEVLTTESISHEVVSSPEFQQALGKTLDNMIYEENKETRDTIKKIFTEAYISQDEYAKKSLGKLQDTAKRMSIPALQHLLFFRQNILPRRDKFIDSDIKRNTPRAGFTEGEHIESKRRTTPVSKFYDEWHQENAQEAQKNFNRNQTEENRRAFDLSGAKEQKLRSRFVEFWTEYNSLGIFRLGNDATIGTVGGGSGTVQYLTGFGERFINYVVAVSEVVNENE